jgi:hypothetical protein
MVSPVGEFYEPFTQVTGAYATALDEAILRMEEAADALHGLMHGRDKAEQERLRSKREGVLLALFYARQERALAHMPMSANCDYTEGVNDV